MGLGVPQQSAPVCWRYQYFSWLLSLPPFYAPHHSPDGGDTGVLVAAHQQYRAGSTVSYSIRDSADEEAFDRPLVGSADDQQVVPAILRLFKDAIDDCFVYLDPHLHPAGAGPRTSSARWRRPRISASMSQTVGRSDDAEYCQLGLVAARNIGGQPYPRRAWGPPPAGTNTRCTSPRWRSRRMATSQ